MRDGLVRRAVKWVARGLHGFELAVTRVLRARRGEPRYRLTGTCNGCGRCCERPAVAAGFFAWRLRLGRALALWWHRVVNGFELVELDRRFHLFVFRCTHYDATTRRCDSYESRPLMCRDYPVNLLYEAVPPLFSECSHGAVDSNAEALIAALEASGVTGERLEVAKRRFVVKEPVAGPRDPSS